MFPAEGLAFPEILYAKLASLFWKMEKLKLNQNQKNILKQQKVKQNFTMKLTQASLSLSIRSLLASFIRVICTFIRRPTYNIRKQLIHKKAEAYNQCNKIKHLISK